MAALEQVAKEAEIDVVKRSRRIATRSTLGSVRLATLVLGVVLTLSLFASLDGQSGMRALTVVSGVLLIGAMVSTYVRGALVIAWDGPGLAGLTVLLGVGVNDPMAVSGAVVGVLMAQSLYGSLASAVLRMLCFLPVLPVCAALTSSRDGAGAMDWNDPVVLSMFPVIVLFWGLMRSLKTSLERAVEAHRREELTASVASHLLGCSDLLQVTQVLKVGVGDLCRITEGLVVASVATERDEDGRIIAARLDHAPGTPGAPVDADLPVEFLRPVEKARPLTFPALPGGTRALAAVGLPELHWFAQHVDIPVTRNSGVDVVLYGVPVSWWNRLPLIGTGPRTDWIESVRVLAMQTTMAEVSVKAYAELAHRAEHDELTAMANRSVLFAELDRALFVTAGSQDEVGLILVDLDDFRHVNDSRGHVVADALLVELARRINDAVGDRALPARFGGDEFAVLLPAVGGAEEAMKIADRVRQRLLEPVELEDGALVLAVSLGVAVTRDAQTAEDLLRCADVALHAAKADSRSRVEIYSARRHGQMARTRQLEERLPHALADGEIAVYFQPIVDLATGRAVGLEALARWQHPDEGVLEAGEFVDIADRNGHGGALGAYMVRAALLKMQDWAHLPGMTDVWLSINVSARQVSDPGFHDTLMTALVDAGLEPQRLVLELPERGLLAGAELRHLLSAIAASGVRIALDDFAAEHASLAQLESIPVTQLKIDRNQLRARDAAGASTMLAMIMSVSGYLGVQTVAEAVETDEHVAWARAAGIALAEGYLFAEPMAPELLTAWLEAAVVDSELRAV